VSHAEDGAGEVAERVRACVRRALGREPRALEPLPAQLSTRAFFRVRLDGEPERLIARVEAPEDPAGRPAGVPPEPPLAPILSYLAAHGLPVPQRLGGDAAQGIDLLEDVGDVTLEAAVTEADAGARAALYAVACALVPRVQRLSPQPGLAAFERRLDAALFAYKADLFVRHSLPLAVDGRPTPAQECAVREGFAHVAAVCAEAPQRLAHRDLQSRNLHVQRAPDGAPRLRLIDVQGALLAPPEYDLVCLLRDSYSELPEVEARRHAEATRPALPDAPAPEIFARRFDLLTLTRKGKDHARFVYAAEARGDRRYLDALPTTVRALHAAATRVRGQDPALADLCELVLSLPEAPPCAR